MKRRNFLVSTAASGMVAFPHSASAALRCNSRDSQGLQQCEAGIPSSVAQVFAKDQMNTQWCWAACIEMVFTYYKHPVSQSRIVQETWGAIVNMPGRPDQLLRDLNRSWTDDNGYNFSVQGDSGSVTHKSAARDLAKNKPLIIGTMGHAMVLTSLTYVNDPTGNGYVTKATVRDPWPGKGRRELTLQEWSNIDFAARITVF